jgi:hypothetical protein
MSNFSKDHPSIRVFAPPGGRSTSNIFGVPEPEIPMPNKKNHMESDIFGCKKDNTDSVPVKQTRNMVNNIFGTEPEQTVQKSNVYSDKNKSTIFDEALPQQPSNKPDRQRSNIFGPNEPVQSASSRPVSEKFKSNIFGNGDNDTQNKRQPGTRQGLRVGYNPINGESYSTKDGLNSKVEQTEVVENETEPDDTVKMPEEENGEQSANGHHEKTDEQPTENGNNEKPTNGNSHESVDKPTNGHANGTNGHSTTKKSAYKCSCISPTWRSFKWSTLVNIVNAYLSLTTTNKK